MTDATPWSPYEQGAEAFRNDIPITANPYPNEPVEAPLSRLAWHNGWRRAAWEREDDIGRQAAPSPWKD